MRADDPRHGTRAGYYTHRREQEIACPPCKAAAAAAQRGYLADRYLGRPRRVDPRGTVRRLQALRALGWTYDQLATELEMNRSATSWITSRERVFVHTTTALKVRAVYARLSSVTPEGGHAERARRSARRRGYLPPAAWDDIDRDPEPPMPDDEDFVDEVVVERILGGDYRLRASAAERAEACRRWVESGRSLGSLARATGWKPERYWKNGEAA